MNRPSFIPLVLILAMPGFAHSVPASASEKIIQAQGLCAQKMGPYQSQYEATQAIQMLRQQGYQTSGVWGEGGVISQWSNRRYYFNVYYPC